ncbi:hypothetical protein SAMN06296427_108146 [Moheibacter sediminis]|uniref:Uncharacterized protein n=1 Tax=Moheibacter sediminis TaxID=1434700 RepID=A0A1W2C503_9FLAO|nr:hypothetical protein SAMN06296427_108146 [Moheibacter sediminis]
MIFLLLCVSEQFEEVDKLGKYYSTSFYTAEADSIGYITDNSILLIMFHMCSCCNLKRKPAQLKGCLVAFPFFRF